MQHLLKKFSPALTSENVGDEILERTEKKYPVQAEKVFDLHGYTQIEAEEKFWWILEYSIEKNFRRIKIVTGVGKKIIFFAIKRQLQKACSKKSVESFIQREGVFEVFL